MALDYLSVLGIFTSLGDALQELFNSDPAIYALYFIVFFISVFTLISRLIQKFGVKLHLDGAPGNVIAFSFSIIATGIIFIGKSSQEVQELFHGSVGIFFIILFALGLGVLAKVLSGKTDHFPTKLFLWSLAVFIGSILLIEAATAIWGQNPSGFGGLVLGMIGTLASLTLLLLLVTGVLALIHLFRLHLGTANGSSGSSSRKEEKKQKKNDLKELKRVLERMNEEHKKISQGMQDLRTMLQNLQMSENENQGGLKR
jgi:hypothetical protein